MDKTISFFWGNERMSWLRYMTLASFRRLNPDWQMRLFVCKQQRDDKHWVDLNQQDFFTYTGPDYTPRLQNLDNFEIIPWEIEFDHLKDAGPSHKSNWFKWQFLANQSGIYADMDILFVRPIDTWFEEIKDKDIAICYHKSDRFEHFSIGLMASSGIGDFFNRVYAESLAGYVPTMYQGAGVIAIYNLLGLSPDTGGHWKKLISLYPHLKLVNFDQAYVYPWNYRQISDLTERIHKSLPAKTIGIHWFAGNALSQKINNELTPQTVTKYPCTIAYFLREIL